MKLAAIALAVGLCLVTLPAHAEQGARAVTIADRQFMPGTAVALVGDTVTWTNEDAVTHTVTADDDSFDSPVPPGTSFSATFDKPGRHPYVCTIHRFMHGEVVVYALALVGPLRPVTAGARAMLRGLVAAGATSVTIQAAKPKRPFRWLATVKPRARGRFTLPVRPRATMRYRAHSGTRVSPTVPVEVAPRVVLRASLGTGGATLGVSAAHAQPLAEVELQLYMRETFSWKTVKRGRLDRRSRASFTLAPRHQRHVRALVRGVGTYATGASNVVVVGEP